MDSPKGGPNIGILLHVSQIKFSVYSLPRSHVDSCIENMHLRIIYECDFAIETV